MHDLMTTKRQREIVIEFEKVQLIRKRAKTTVEHCDGCNAGSDFVGIEKAADLFGISVQDLFRFVAEAAVHFQSRYEDMAICVPSLLATMQQKQITTRRVAVGMFALNDFNNIDEL